MKIPCPQCAEVVEFKTSKAGRFKLHCDRCNTDFGLQVEAGTPPKLTRFRLPADTQAKPQAKPQANTPANAPIKVVATPADEATVDSAPQAATVPLDQTMDEPQAKSGKTSSAPSLTPKQKPVVRAGGSQPAAASVKSNPTRQVASASTSPAPRDSSIPERLGGYRLLNLLGQGAMGAVYQARQLSLDRNVALKVIRSQWANSPSALVRFTREAYAAAQLTHHNVVQIYDFGEDQGQHFFSMEWVRGGPLSDLLKDRGPLEPRLAAGYILQAARGLQFAHRNGMVHRDVKPANLLLDEEGVVKVADLGLVKVPDAPDPVSGVGSAEAQSGYGSGSQVTAAGSTVGTPAYMAPEQAEDAAMVDHRADIYSLGCTMFHLLSGKPPFSGKAMSEVLEMHRKQPAPSVRQINASIPKALDEIIQKSMTKRIDDRYANLGEMIADLEKFLGVQGGSSMQLSADQASLLEAAAGDFNAASLGRLRIPILGSSLLVAALGFSLLLFVAPSWSIAPPLLVFAAFGMHLVLAGFRGTSPVATAIRSALGTASWLDWLTWALGLAAVTVGCAVTGLLWAAIPSLLLGAGLGAAYFFLIDRGLAGQRRSAVEQVERVVREMRLSGVDEPQIRRLVAKFSGKHWEELFSEVFGYSALQDAREEMIRSNEHGGRARFWPWRDWLIARLQQRVDEAKRQRAQVNLAKVEQAGLQAEGLSAADAEARAWQIASALIEANRQATAAGGSAAISPEAAAAAKRARMRAMLAEARSGAFKKRRSPLAVGLSVLFSGKLRFLLGCILLAGFAMWAKENGIVGQGTIEQISPELTSVQVQDMARGIGSRLLRGDGQPIWFQLIQGLSAAMAGMILLVSSLSSGWRMTSFAVVASSIALFGNRLGVPAVGPLSAELVATAAGFVAFIPALFFGYESEGDW